MVGISLVIRVDRVVVRLLHLSGWSKCYEACCEAQRISTMQFETKLEVEDELVSKVSRRVVLVRVCINAYRRCA